MTTPGGAAADGSAIGDVPPRSVGISRATAPLSVIWVSPPGPAATQGCESPFAVRPQADYRLRGSPSRAAGALRGGRRPPQDSTHMPPSGDARPPRPLLPSTDEGTATGRKDRDGCPV